MTVALFMEKILKNIKKLERYHQKFFLNYSDSIKTDIPFIERNSTNLLTLILNLYKILKFE